MIARASNLPATARPLSLVRRQDIDVESLFVRGERWWRLKDPLRLQFWQFGDEEHFLWSQVENGVSLLELQQRFARRFAPRRIELADLHLFLGTLHREGLVFSTAAAQAEVLLERQKQQRSRQQLQRLTNVFAIRFRGIDPTGLLDWIYPRVAWMFSTAWLGFCGILILSALLLAVTSAEQLFARLPHAAEFLTSSNLVWLALTLAVVKVCHELGHALACRHHGGRCHELGVMLLIFTPCLYCNVSDAWLLPSRWRRMAISAAGMAVELTLAAMATWLWWFSEPGLFSTLCLNVMVIGSVNTLLFNGNPLLRFDGYFLLSDFLEFPNLRQAADDWLRSWMGRILLGVRHDNPRSKRTMHSVIPNQDRHFLLAVYAMASLAYRVFLTAVVFWFIYHWFADRRLAIVGAAIVVLSAATIVGQASWQAWRMGSTAWREQRLRTGRALVSLVVAMVVLASIGMVPWPRSVIAPAVLRPADADTVYVTLSGSLLSSVAPGTRVNQGDILARLRNPELEQDVLRLTGERDVLRRQVESLTRQQVQDSRSGMANVAAQLRTMEQQLADVTTQLNQMLTDQQQLTIRATRPGVVIAARIISKKPRRHELPRWKGTPLDKCNLGCTLEPGDVLCQIGEPDHREAFLVVEQSEIDYVGEGQPVSVQLDELPRSNLRGTVRMVAELSATAPPPELVAKRLLPVSRVSEETRLLETHYQVTVTLADDLSVPFGASGRAKIQVAPQTIAGRIYEQVCRVFRW